MPGLRAGRARAEWEEAEEPVALLLFDLKKVSTKRDESEWKTIIPSGSSGCPSLRRRSQG